jgi:HD-like signal output (HDOD) protein
LDPGLTGQVLRFVNSSYFGFSREISSVKLAITLVGIRTIRNFALWSAVFSLIPNPRCGPFQLKSLWQDSLRRALFARSAAKLLGLKDAEGVFAGALLQDMAVPVLARAFPQAYAELLQERELGRTRVSELERQRFGRTHAEFGGQMARRWNLPEEFGELIERHTSLDELLSDRPRQPAPLAVAWSALLPSEEDDRWWEIDSFESCYHQLSTPSFPGVIELLAETDREYAEFAPMMNVAAPGRTLAQWFAAARQRAS